MLQFNNWQMDKEVKSLIELIACRRVFDGSGSFTNISVNIASCMSCLRRLFDRIVEQLQHTDHDRRRGFVIAALAELGGCLSCPA